MMLLGTNEVFSDLMARSQEQRGEGMCDGVEFADPEISAIVGFLAGYSNTTDDYITVMDAASRVFDAQVVYCASAGTGDYVTGRKRLAAPCPPAVVDIGRAEAVSTAGLQACYIAGIEGIDLERAKAAGEKMHKKGWWKDGWEWRWKLLSGYTPPAKNPLYWGLGGAAVIGLLAWRKRRKGRR